MRFILPLILIGISITSFFLFVDPFYKEMGTLREKISSYDSALDNSKALEKERDSLIKKSNAFNKDNLEKLSKLLPDSVDNIRLILEIEKIASPYGMVLKDVKYDTVDEKEKAANKLVGLQANTQQVARKDYGVWELGFSIQGTYGNFYNFVKDLEKNLRIVDVVSVDFSSNTGVGINPALSSIYKYDFRIKTYWLKN
jgi:Tfp pilus assembly protein PilO